MMELLLHDDLLLSTMMICQIYQEDVYHSVHYWRAVDDFYHKQVKYIGGGYCSLDYAEFDSSSCKKEFGFDRPKDVQIQKEILDELKKYIENL